MGIPFFARFLARSMTSSNIMSAPPLDDTNDAACRVFIDFNGTIHEAARDVFHLDESMPDAESTEDMIMHASVERLVARCKQLAPSIKLLFVAVDGVPPRAKMQQQRYRRFASTWIKAQQTTTTTTTTPTTKTTHWDSNAITPGTRFMERMNDYLHARQSDIRERIGAQTLIISGPDEAGEGEQKIFSFLRRNPSQDQGSVDLVYGMDADLILQSLLWHSDSKIGGLWVVREENNDEDVVKKEDRGRVKFVFIDIRRLLAGIERKFHCTADDFALLCVFIGNDFVPRLPSVSVQDGGIDALMQARRKVLESSNAHAIVDAGTKFIDMRLLTRVVEVLSQTEGEALQAAEARHQDMQRKVTQYQRNRPANIVDDLPLLRPFPNGLIEPSRPGWRPRYHRHVMHLDVAHGGGCEEDSSELSVACNAYLRGVVWSYKYTAQICLSKSWYYPFSAAPTATDLHNFMLCHPDARDVEGRLAKLDTDENNQDLVITDPILQLLAVLPPQSAHLLPDHARALLTTLRHGLMHMYPVEFEFCTYLKYKTWECHPILPRVDVAALKRQLLLLS